MQYLANLLSFGTVNFTNTGVYVWSFIVLLQWSLNKSGQLIMKQGPKKG